MCRPNNYPPYEDNEMREENYGPVVNPDGTPTDATLEIMGFRRRVGDTFTWYPTKLNGGESDYGSYAIITGFTATGVLINYQDVDPPIESWEIPFSEAM